jgi:maleylacetate reductase
MRSFSYLSNPVRVVFGAGTSGQVRDEVKRLGRSRVLLLAGPRLSEDAARVAEVLGPLVVARFDGAAMHTPVEVTEQALAVLHENSADCVVAIGGGSTTGLAKALALRSGVDQVILATTYAGSEVTPVLGETSDGLKTTQSSPEILPETVIYDVDLTLGLPVPTTVASAVNALAHAVEALYSPDANPVVDAMALEAIAGIARALPRVVADPSEAEARGELLQGAWLAATCLGAVRMGLHHKLCHTLGGSFGLPHAETHTVVLPHAMAYNASSAPEVMRRIADALGVTDAPSAVFDLIESAGGPTSLRGLGMSGDDLAKAAELATAKPYPNPRELTKLGIEALLDDAWHGRRPATSPLAELDKLTAQVVASFDNAADDRIRSLLTDLVRHLHHFAVSNDLTESEWQYGIDFLTRTGQISDDKRQEFILLSDTLGVSSVVDLMTNSRTPGTTPSAVLGPFYVEGPPAAEHGYDLAEGLPGTPLWVDVRITGPDGEPVPDAVVDVWQSNEDGFYDVQLPDLDGPVLRARFHSDGLGGLTFWTIVPVAYPIPSDGPVGKMLDKVGRHPFRAPHVHFMISAPGYQRLVTQLFVGGGDYLDSDTVFGVKEKLIIDFAAQDGPTPDGRVVDGKWRKLDFAFHIAKTPTAKTPTAKTSIAGTGADS